MLNKPDLITLRTILKKLKTVAHSECQMAREKADADRISCSNICPNRKMYCDTHAMDKMIIGITNELEK